MMLSLGVVHGELPPLACHQAQRYLISLGFLGALTINVEGTVISGH